VNDTAIIIFIGLLIFVVWFVARKGRAAKNSDQQHRQAVQEANKSLRALNNEMAPILLEIDDLENALKEATAQGDDALAKKISKALVLLEGEANRLIDQYQRDSKK
jgi:flagellar biosynthesis/type III secretory pathway M-ring protein FliF/YscJ